MAVILVFSMGLHRRSEVEIMGDILEVCLRGTNKTKIVYDANLNFTSLNKYLSMLLGLGFVTVSVGYKGSNSSAVNFVYRTTKAGKDFFDGCLNMQKMLGRPKFRVKPLI